MSTLQRKWIEMKQIIFKYPLEPGENQIEMPQNPQFLSVGYQAHDKVVLWAMVNPNSPRQLQTFHVVPTGVPFDVAWDKFIGTVQMPSPLGELVFHVLHGTSGGYRI